MAFEPFSSSMGLTGPGGYFLPPASYASSSTATAFPGQHAFPSLPSLPVLPSSAPVVPSQLPPPSQSMQASADELKSPSLARRRGSSLSSFASSVGDSSQYYDPIKHRRRTTAPQLQVLEAQFAANSKPDPTRRRELSNELGMTPREIQVWFQNRRAKQKKLNKRAEQAQDVEETAGSEGGEGSNPSRRGSLASTTYAVSNTDSGSAPSYSRRGSHAPMFAAMSVVPPTSAPLSRRESASNLSHIVPASSSHLPPQAATPVPSGFGPGGMFPPPVRRSEGYDALDFGTAPVAMGMPAPFALMAADEAAWRRRGSIPDGSDAVTPLTAEFSFGTESHAPSSVTSFDAGSVNDFDPRRRSSCPADLLNSMGSVALSHRMQGFAPLSSIDPAMASAAPTAQPTQQQVLFGQHPIMSWSSGVPATLAGEDPSPSTLPDQWLPMLPRRHSVSAAPRQEMPPAGMASVDPYATAQGGSPEASRSPLPHHVYPHYNASRGSSGSSLLPIDEHDDGPFTDAHLRPTSRGASTSPYETFQRTLSSPARLGYRRPTLERRAQSQAAAAATSAVVAQQMVFGSSGTGSVGSGTPSPSLTPHHSVPPPGPSWQPSPLGTDGSVGSGEAFFE